MTEKEQLVKDLKARIEQLKEEIEDANFILDTLYDEYISKIEEE